MKRALLVFAALFALLPFGISPKTAQAIGQDNAIAFARAKSVRGGKTVNLVIHNSEDYIVGNPNDIAGDEEAGQFNLVGAFEKYCLLHDGVTVNVAYQTFSVMEDELSNLGDGAHYADLVCVSDYIIQRLMENGMVIPFATGAERDDLYRNGGGLEGWETDNYETYASPFLKKRLGEITANVGGDPAKVGNLGDYARGYMWGTLGLTYNPAFSGYADEGLSENDVKVQMSDWNSLWASQYERTFQFKDSMRDAFSIALMHVYDGYFKVLRGWYVSGEGVLPDGSTGPYSSERYNDDVSTIFNNVNRIGEFNALAKRIDPRAVDVDEATIVNEAQFALSELKEKSYGMEIDSGKTDIQTGTKSGIDTAWSGDAILAMLGAEDYGNSLYYSVPKTGGNIWFDAWVMIKSDTLEQEYAQKFIDFISDPVNASPNMDYNCYTSFVGGDAIVDLVRSLYDPRTSAMYVYHEDEENGDNSGYLYGDDDNRVLKDGTGVHPDTGDDYGEYDMRGSTYGAPAVAGHPEIATWDDYAASPLFVGEDENPWETVDLSYFFAGTLSEYAPSDMIFYTNELETVTGRNLEGQEETVTVGRRFLAQYPTEDEAYKGTVRCQIPSLAVMENYSGDINDYVLTMWENVKAGGTIQPWIIALISLEVAAALGLGLYFFFKGARSKTLRKKRREERLGAK
jgi:spermidine/putrescine-binding protein